MKITVELDDKEIERIVMEKVTDEIAKQYMKRYNDDEIGRRRGVQDAVKELVYNNKDELITRCVDKASAELVRKGLPKLLEKMSDNA
jgi:hypothetical protein